MNKSKMNKNLLKALHNIRFDISQLAQNATEAASEYYQTSKAIDKVQRTLDNMQQQAVSRCTQFSKEHLKIMKSICTKASIEVVDADVFSNVVNNIVDIAVVCYIAYKDTNKTNSILGYIKQIGLTSTQVIPITEISDIPLTEEDINNSIIRISNTDILSVSDQYKTYSLQ